MSNYTKAELVKILEDWRDQDEPLVEAIGETLAEFQRVDSQEMGRRIVDTLIDVLEHHLP